MASVMRKMNIISRCEAIYRTEKTDGRLQGVYHSYILTICRNPGLSQERLAKHMCINKSSVTRHLAYLEKNGYVERRPSEKDKREMLVYPTDKMLGAHSEVKAITQEWNGLLAEGVTEEELEIFHKILDRMLDKSVELVYSEGNAK